MDTKAYWKKGTWHDPEYGLIEVCLGEEVRSGYSFLIHPDDLALWQGALEELKSEGVIEHGVPYLTSRAMGRKEPLPTPTYAEKMGLIQYDVVLDGKKCDPDRLVELLKEKGFERM